MNSGKPTGQPDTARSAAPRAGDVVVARISAATGGIDVMTGPVADTAGGGEPQFPDMDRLIDGPEAAALLNLSRGAWAKRVSRGTAPAADDPGRRPRWKLATLVQWQWARG